jgi:hypothetical protein
MEYLSVTPQRRTFGAEVQEGESPHAIVTQDPTPGLRRDPDAFAQPQGNASADDTIARERHAR